ncbi:MAG: hypothetical protein WC551_08565 [Patescibacteria group bacterium]
MSQYNQWYGRERGLHVIELEVPWPCTGDDRDDYALDWVRQFRESKNPDLLVELNPVSCSLKVEDERLWCVLSFSEPLGHFAARKVKEDAKAAAEEAEERALYEKLKAKFEPR